MNEKPAEVTVSYFDDIGHITGMDAYARGVKAAHALRESYALENSKITNTSGRQEMLEGIINRYL